MAIKEICIKGTGGENLMPSMSQVPASYLPGAPKVQSLQEWLDDFAKRRVAMAEYRKAFGELMEREPEIPIPKSTAVAKEEKKERYLVDSGTGVISIDVENGEYNYRDAQLRSSSIKASRGEYDQAITLINALKGNQSAGAEAKPRVWDVEENGEIRYDDENGPYTLGEAREVSRSRIALIPREDNTVTKDKMELWKRDVKDEIKGIVSEEVGKVKALLPPAGSHDHEVPFFLDEKGEVQINKGAKLGIMEFVLFNSLKAAGKQDRLYKDKEGNVMDLPSYLEVRRFEREEHRKDKMNDSVTELFQMGKAELPKLIQGIQNMTTSKKAEEALDKGGWGKKAEPKRELSPKAKTAPCASGCGTIITFTEVPAILACPKCHTLNFAGTKEEFNEIADQLSAARTGGDNKPEGEKGKKSEEEKK